MIEEQRIGSNRPVVLCIGGHDPSGGAGILADAEAIRAAGAFAVTVVTALTDQDTCGLRHVYPQPPEQVAAQCRALIADSTPRAIKIGLIGSAPLVPVLAAIIDANPSLPVVLDPVLASGAGQSCADSLLLNQLRQQLIPRSTLITPNLPEAHALVGGGTADQCVTVQTPSPQPPPAGRGGDDQALVEQTPSTLAGEGSGGGEACLHHYAARLLDTGARWVLITGTHNDTAQVTNRLYGPDGYRQDRDWPRLPGEYHGSGCTLASAIAARLARGMTMEEAVAAAQDYTWNTLQQAFRSGRCQLTPNRLFDLHPGFAQS